MPHYRIWTISCAQDKCKKNCKQDILASRVGLFFLFHFFVVVVY